MRALDVTEIHGYRPELGLRVFTQTALEGETGSGNAPE
jgi:arginine decarboxylase